MLNHQQSTIASLDVVFLFPKITMRASNGELSAFIDDKLI